MISRKRGMIVALAVCALMCCVLASPVAAQPINSINATFLRSTFAPVGGDYGRGKLIISDNADIVVDTIFGQMTYDGGSFAMQTSLFLDTSVGGLASANFQGGTIVIYDGSHAQLFSAKAVTMEMHEVVDGLGLLAGRGTFVVVNGTLAPDFGPAGEVVEIAFRLNPPNISDFSVPFVGKSNVTLTPIPEPATLALLLLGSIGLIRRRRS